MTADSNADLAGYVIALPPGCDYDSVNYRWFSSHYDAFLYIDRIMVEPTFRQQGVAQFLYRSLKQIAITNRLARLTCEVNIQPPNPASLALHKKIGFVEAATQETEGGSKEVSLLVLEC